MSLLLQNGAKALEDLRKQQSKMKEGKRQASAGQQIEPQKKQSYANPVPTTPASKQPKKYVLTVLKENGQWEPLTAEEMAEFER